MVVLRSSKQTGGGVDDYIFSNFSSPRDVYYFIKDPLSIISENLSKTKKIYIKYEVKQPIYINFCVFNYLFNLFSSGKVIVMDISKPLTLPIVTRITINQE